VTAISGDPHPYVPVPIAHWHEQIGIRPSPIAFSTDWSQRLRVELTGESMRKKRGRKRMNRILTGSLQCWSGARELKRRPLAPPPPSRSQRKTLDHVNNLRHHSNTIVATLRLYSHRVGTAHSHRRNPHEGITPGKRAGVNRPDIDSKFSCCACPARWKGAPVQFVTVRSC